MKGNHQDTAGSNSIATEGKRWLPPVSPKEQKKVEHKKTKPFLIVVGIGVAFVGTIALIYAWFRFNWPLWLLISLGILEVLLLLILLIRVGYTAQWTGFGGYDKVTKESTLDGQSSKTTQEHQPGKKLWDWLQLLAALAIPAAIAIGTTWFSYQQNQTSMQIAESQQQEATLKSYLDDMSDLLLTHHLRNAQPGDEVRTVARVRTLTTLRRLNSTRKGFLLNFLYESGLIEPCEEVPEFPITTGTEKPVVVSLFEADLSGADLTGAGLFRADLRRTNLRGAHLSGADLYKAGLFADAISIVV